MRFSATGFLVNGFYENLAADDDRWDDLVAGVAVLRATEAAVRGDEGGGLIQERAREFVAKVRGTATRNTLTAILRVATPLVRIDDGELAVLAGKLMTYGIRLHDDGLFAAAGNVFTVVEDLAEHEPDLLMQAIYRRGFALRCLQRFDEAATTYERLATTAERFASSRMASTMALDAALGLGKIMIERGNLPGAAAAVDAVRRRAEGQGDTAVLAKALIDLAAIAGIRQDPAKSIQYAYQALAIVVEEQQRERLLVNMAHAFRHVGHPDAARRIVERLAVSSRMAEHRAFAQLLRYDLAIDAADWPAAEACRATLGALHLSPRLGAEYYETVARHLAATGAPTSAISMLERMLAVAEEHELGELVFRAEQAMADIRRGIVPAAYEFRPLARIPKQERAAVAEVERSIDALLAV